MDPNSNTPVTRREKLWRIIFLSDTPGGRTFDLVLLILIILSVLTLMFESVEPLRQKHTRTKAKGVQDDSLGLLPLSSYPRSWKKTRKLNPNGVPDWQAAKIPIRFTGSRSWGPEPRCGSRAVGLFPG